MTKEMETPKPKNSDDHNEWLERQIDRELDKTAWDFEPQNGSFKGMAEVERNLKKKKS